MAIVILSKQTKEYKKKIAAGALLTLSVNWLLLF